MFRVRCSSFRVFGARFGVVAWGGRLLREVDHRVVAGPFSGVDTNPRAGPARGCGHACAGPETAISTEARGESIFQERLVEFSAQ